MLSIWRSPRNESNPIEAQQAGPRSDPQISVSGLCNSKWSAAKNSVLNPPGGVCVLGNMAAGINCPDQLHSEKKQQKAQKMPQWIVRPVCFSSRVCTPPFERVHRQDRAPCFEEHTCTADCSKMAESPINLGADAAMRFTRTIDFTGFAVFAEHRNVQPASCSFLQASECDQICSRPRRTAMVTAWVRSLA